MKRGCRYYLRLLSVACIGGLLVFCGGCEIMYVESMTVPLPSTPCCLTPADLGLSYENVTISSVDNVQLSGWYIPSQNRAAVILLHGYGSNRAMMLPTAQALARHGYGVLLYDLRAHGQSSGAWRTMGWLDLNDIPAALAFLQHRQDVNPERIGIHGFSVGGQIAIRAGAQYNAIKAVIAEEPGFVKIEDAPAPKPDLIELGAYAMNWVDERGIELRTGVPAPTGIADLIGKIAPRPIFIMGSGGSLSDRLAAHFYDLAGNPKTLWQVPETYHGGIPQARPQEYESKIVSFFDQALLSSSQ